MMSPHRRPDDDFDDLRAQLRDIDAELVDLADRRIEIVRKIGDLKRERNLPLRDNTVEHEAVETVRAACRDRGVSPDLGEELVQRFIKEALRVQEADAHAHANSVEGEDAVVVGGAGAMGRWFTGFLQDAGYRVIVVDPAGPVGDVDYETDLVEAAAESDLVLISTPPSTVDEVLSNLQGVTDALVVDIASIKGPFEDRLRAMAESSLPVSSIHPMWGPKTDILVDKNLLVCDAGHSGATEAVRSLFAHTTVNLVEISLAEHDAIIAFTLGLPHAVNLIFGDVLSSAPRSFSELDYSGGPTFRNQVEVAAGLASENKDLYFEIQALNEHMPAIYDGLGEALDGLEADLEGRDDFVARMETVHRWFNEEPPNDFTDGTSEKEESSSS